MANPNNNGDEPKPSTAGNGTNNGAAKPRATIVMKNPNANPGSSARVAPATGNPPGSSARVQPARSTRRQAVAVDREALGLSAARPSEMIAGLDEAAKRAEALAKREELRRKSGGKMAANIALHVDDTGRKWALWVKLGIAAILIGGSAIAYYLIYAANHHVVTPREAREKTAQALIFLDKTATLMEPFKDSDQLTAASAKERVRKHLEEDLDKVKVTLARDFKAGRNPDKRAVEERDFLIGLLAFKDGFGKDLEFGVEGDDLTIASPSKFEGDPLEPVKVRVREGKADKPDKAEKSSKTEK
ncbi:MAG TPA: hypothetical protein VKX17_11915 [Planctomycetota bacterium]|nr:hypothetical protein [Planctomycetota bacterium]